MDRGFTILLSGHKGAGKTTIGGELLKLYPGAKKVITYTTRKKRDEEVHGRDYYFIPEATFLYERDHNNTFFEWSKRVTEQGEYYYGTSLYLLDRAMAENFLSVTVVDAVGIKAYKHQFGKRVLTVWLDVPMRDLDRRLSERPGAGGSDPSERATDAVRFKLCRREGLIDFVVDNRDGNKEKTILTIHQMINTYRLTNAASK